MLIAHTDVDFENGKKGVKKKTHLLPHFIFPSVHPLLPSLPTCHRLSFISWSHTSDLLIASFVYFDAITPLTPRTQTVLS